jgi:hypothetical protein
MKPDGQINPVASLIQASLLFIALVCPCDLFSQAQMKMDNDSAFTHEMRGSMEVMHKDMLAASMTGDPDHDFITMMIPHHQGAIDMAKVVLLKRSRNSTIGSGNNRDSATGNRSHAPALDRIGIRRGSRRGPKHK